MSRLVPCVEQDDYHDRHNRHDQRDQQKFLHGLEQRTGKVRKLYSTDTPVASAHINARADTADTHPEMRERMTSENDAIYKAMARGLKKFIPAKELPMPAEQFVKVMDALMTGLLFTYFQTPALMPEAVFVAAFEALA